MKNKIYNCAALTSFDRLGFAVNGRKEGKAPLAWERCRNKQKPFLPRNPAYFDDQTASKLQGLFVCADCEYGRDNQPKATIGSAAITSAGGNGGLSHRANAGTFSLLGQAFKPELEDVEVCDCRKRWMAPQGHTLKGRAQPVNSGLG